MFRNIWWPLGSVLTVCVEHYRVCQKKYTYHLIFSPGNKILILIFFILVIRICVFTIFSHQTLVYIYICSTSSSSSVVGTVCCPRAKEVGEKTATTTSEPRLKVPRPTWQQQLARQRQNTFLRLLFSSITFSQRGIPTLAPYRDSQIM